MRDASMSSSAREPSYAMVLRQPHALVVFGAALIGRLSYGIVFVALTVALTQVTGSYAWTGASLALFGLSATFLAPLRAGLIDRYGPGRTLPTMATTYAVLLGCLTITTWRPGAPRWALLALPLLAGACTPPLGPVMRTIWSDLLAGQEALRRRAFSLDSTAEELLYVTGPLIAGLFITAGHAAAGVAASALLVLTGTIAMTLSPAMCVQRKATAEALTTAKPEPLPSVGLLCRDLELLAPALVTSTIGIALGAIDVLVVAFAERHHHIAAAAWLEISVSVGSAVGGIAYGARAWRLSGRARLPLLAIGLGSALSVTGFAPNLYAMALGLGIAGLFVAPALATAYLIADESAPACARTQAGTWVNSAFNAGSTGGTASAGLLLGGVPPALCFGLAAIPALLTATATLVRLRAPAPETRAPTQDPV